MQIISGFRFISQTSFISRISRSSSFMRIRWKYKNQFRNSFIAKEKLPQGIRVERQNNPSRSCTTLNGSCPEKWSELNLFAIWKIAKRRSVQSAVHEEWRRHKSVWSILHNWASLRSGQTYARGEESRIASSTEPWRHRVFQQLKTSKLIWKLFQISRATEKLINL